MSSVKLEHITKRFKGTTALDNVSLEVKNKEFFVIFGPAGAGKTTLLNVIAGILIPDTGNVSLNREVINHLEPEERDVAMVFENYAIYPHFTVFENMASPLQSPKYKREKEYIEKEIQRVATMLGIDGLLNRKPSELSNGQRQRVALGRALVRNPEVFLMDEPLTHLDAKLRHQMRAELKDMQKNLDSTTIYVTHDYLEALGLGDRIAVINEGKVEQVGTPGEIYNQPNNEFVAASFGEPEINILEVNVSYKNSKFYIKPFKEGISLEVANEIQPYLEGKKRIRIGIRPKNIEYQFEKNENNTAGIIYSFEPFGAKAMLVVKVDDDLIRLVAPSDLQVQINQAIYIQPDLSKGIFFDENRENLLYNNGERKGEKRFARANS